MFVLSTWDKRVGNYSKRAPIYTAQIGQHNLLVWTFSLLIIILSLTAQTLKSFA
jgi:hypothetical protein